MEDWFNKLCCNLVGCLIWHKPKKATPNLRNPAPKVYGPKRRKIKKY